MRPALAPLAAKKRIRRFFDEPTAERRAVSHFIEQIADSADVFVFGGALRDISLLGMPRFSGDVDIVVQVHDFDVFTDVLSGFDATENKFGGHRVRFGRWNFDIWEVANTWAFSVGAVEAQSHLSLLETTFFNWDAILYDWRSGSLHHSKEYFSELSEMYLELVLEENPNNVGALVRTLRLLCLSDEIRTGPKLTQFLKKGLSEISDDDIMMHEAQSFVRRRLSLPLLSELKDRASFGSAENRFQWLPKQQLSFFEKFAN